MWSGLPGACNYMVVQSGGMHWIIIGTEWTRRLLKVESCIRLIPVSSCWQWFCACSVSSIFHDKLWIARLHFSAKMVRNRCWIWNLFYFFKSARSLLAVGADPSYFDPTGISQIACILPGCARVCPGCRAAFTTPARQGVGIGIGGITVGVAPTSSTGAHRPPRYEM